MAARLNKRQQEVVKDHIQTTQLIKRLQDHALGIVEMSATQVRAAESLIKKRLPDLAAVQHSGDSDNPLFPDSVNVNVVRPKERRDPTDG